MSGSTTHCLICGLQFDLCGKFDLLSVVKQTIADDMFPTPDITSLEDYDFTVERDAMEFFHEYFAVDSTGGDFSGIKTCDCEGVLQVTARPTKEQKATPVSRSCHGSAENMDNMAHLPVVNQSPSPVKPSLSTSLFVRAMATEHLSQPVHSKETSAPLNSGHGRQLFQNDVTVLKPVQILPKTDSAVALQSAQDKQTSKILDFQDFEGQSCSPFDSVALKSLNDLEELQAILQPKLSNMLGSNESLPPTDSLGNTDRRKPSYSRYTYEPFHRPSSSSPNKSGLNEAGYGKVKDFAVSEAPARPSFGTSSADNRDCSETTPLSRDDTSSVRHFVGFSNIPSKNLTNMAMY